jgi:hypothetical protein
LRKRGEGAVLAVKNRATIFVATSRKEADIMATRIDALKGRLGAAGRWLRSHFHLRPPRRPHKP